MSNAKDLTPVGARETPELELDVPDDPAARQAASSFGPDALRAEAERLTGSAVGAEGTNNNHAGTTATTSRTVATKAAAAPPTRPSRPRRGEPSAPAAGETGEELHRKTGYPSEGGRLFLARFRRRYHIAKTLVAEYAIEQFFGSVGDEEIIETLGERGRRREPAPRRSLTVKVDTASSVRIESLKDNDNIPEGVIIGHAIDWLTANRTEEEIAAALRARGGGYYRPERLPA
jgi:hypothetical protein